ncbi:SDR family NAD(P)-dependent oxidoreductase [Terriglobus roseus]|nr:SDR family oxidoreductase [Terriglobus roseus]
MQLQGKTAIITGGTGGIGFAIAASLAAEGAEVTITGRTQESIDKALGELSASVGSDAKVKGLAADLGTAGGARTLLSALPATDILVNNLGIYEAKAFGDITDEDWLHLFEVNVMSGVRASRGYLPGMIGKNWGRIIFIASESAIMVPQEMIHYGMTKTAQLTISRGLAETTKGTGVTVNAVLPGPTRSANIMEFLRSVSEHPDAGEAAVEAEFFDKYRPTSLLHRLIESEEIAHLVTYLASPLSSATNGAALRAEGGLVRSIV